MAMDLAVVDAPCGAPCSRAWTTTTVATVPELAGVVTTGENLARAFWQWLAGALPPGSLPRVSVVETEKNSFEYAARPRGAPDERGDAMERLVRELLKELGEDARREGLEKTPARVATALRYLTSGYTRAARRSSTPPSSPRSTTRWSW